MQRKKGILAVLALCACAIGASAQVDYATASTRADRAFANGEWATAAAYYNHMLRQQPDECRTYGPAIVANELMGDTIAPMQLLDQAMRYGMPLDSVLSDVRRCSFEMGRGNLYEHFMLSAASTHPWLQRPLDSALLRYYEFRHDGPMVVAYSQRMLAGSPQNVKYMLTLAQGYMLCGERQKAEQTWLSALQAQPDCYEAALALANLYDQDGDRARALKMYEKAHALRPTPYVATRIGQLKRGK